MGNKGSMRLADISQRVEARTGRISLSGRYHRMPRRIEDDYEIVAKVLGSGYNGVVRMATSRQSKSEQTYAVKAFKMSAVSGEKKAQLQAEVEIFLCMDHPHVTRLFDVYESEDYLHLVMECMEGGELFDRVTELKRFSERDAADAVYQMLLALNYIHKHGIVHRDLKLENFLYDKKGSSHLKLIDFGFSKMWDPNIKMHVSCGTLSYVAPEVLEKNYTSQCDLWSLGVVTFIILAGYMPFSGNEALQTRNISEGKYVMKPDRWNGISKEAKTFVNGLLQVNPEKRLDAQAALEHSWIESRHKHSSDMIDDGVVAALRQFGQASKFRRCCMEMMAWSLSNEERSKVRDYFLALDKNHHGTVTLSELKQVLEDKFHVSDEETRKIFAALDTNHDEEIHYSDFLAAMVSTRIALHDDLLRSTFRRFDVDNSGFITEENLRVVLGNTFEGEKVEKLITEACSAAQAVSQKKTGDAKRGISYPEFVSYLRGDPDEEHAEAAESLINVELRRGGSSTSDASPMEQRGRVKLKPKDDFKPAGNVKQHDNQCHKQCCAIQ